MSENSHDQVTRAVHGDRPAPAQYVRQSRGGASLLAVLAATLVLTAIGFAIVWRVWVEPLGTGDADANAGQLAVDTAAFSEWPRAR